MASWFSNREAIEHVPISDRGFQYGDGLFETVAIRDSEPRLWEYHRDRLVSGCVRIGLAPPAERDLLIGIEHALHYGDVMSEYCTVKIIVSAGAGARGYGRETVTSPQVLFGVFSSVPPALVKYRNGVDTDLCRTRLAINSGTAGLKTLNRMEQVLARSELAGSSSFEGLTMDADNNIICGTMSNVFFVSNKTILTPAVDRCGVAGVMRRHVIETLQLADMTVNVEAFPATALDNVDEVFLSNSQFGVMPVATCGENTWGVGETTKNVMTHLVDAGIAECRL